MLLKADNKYLFSVVINTKQEAKRSIMGRRAIGL